MKRLHSLMFFLVFLFIGVTPTVDAASVDELLTCDGNAWEGQPGACPNINDLYDTDKSFKAVVDKTLDPVGLDGMFGSKGYLDGPGGNMYPVNINNKIWIESGGCKANACGWEYIVTLYNPHTKKLVGYYYNIDPGYLIWFGDIGVAEFAYLVKKYVEQSKY